MSDKPELSVIIPSYNEDVNFERGALQEALDYLEASNFDWELILTDDGSKPSFQAKLEDFACKDKRIRVIKNPHRGKGPTVQSGMLQAQGQWRLFTDFDQSTPLSEIEKLWPYTTKGYDVVFGSREIIGAKRDKEPWYRHLMGRGFNLLVQILAIPGILDTQCGFKLFSQEAAEKLFVRLVIYGAQKNRQDAFTGAFDVEALFLAKKYGFEMREVPILWKHYETDRVSPIKDSIRMLIDIVKIRLAEARGKYKLD